MGTPPRKLFRGRIIFDFPTITPALTRVGQFSVIALSSATGIAESDLVVEKAESRTDSKKTIIHLSVFADTEIDGWARITKLRKAVADKCSVLNSVGHMKKVFTGAILHVFEPGSSENNRDNKKASVRYREGAPLVPFVFPTAPTSVFPQVTSSLMDDEKPPVSPNHKLPPDASHIPFDVLVIPPGADCPPVSPKREVHFHLPKHSRSEAEDNPLLSIAPIDMKSLVAILNSPKPALPANLNSLFR